MITGICRNTTFLKNVFTIANPLHRFIFDHDTITTAKNYFMDPGSLENLETQLLQIIVLAIFILFL